MQTGGFSISGSPPDEWHRFAESEECWDTIDPDSVNDHSTGDYFAMMALNHSAGHLAEFWVRVEPMTGIEPAYSAWEADVLPLNYIGIPGYAGDHEG